MKTSLQFRSLRALRRLGAALLFSAALAATVAAAHAEPLVSVQWLNSHRADPNVVVLDIRSAIDGGGAKAYAAAPEDFAGACAPCGAPCPSKK